MGEIVLVILVISIVNAFLSRTRSIQQKGKTSSDKSYPARGSFDQTPGKKERSVATTPKQLLNKKKNKLNQPVSKASSATNPKHKKNNRQKLANEVSDNGYEIRRRTMKKSRYADRNINIEVEDLSNEDKAKLRPVIGFSSTDVVKGVIWKELLDRQTF